MNVSEEKISVHMTVSVQHSCRVLGLCSLRTLTVPEFWHKEPFLGLVSSGIYDSLSLECLGLGMQTPCKDESDGEPMEKGSPGSSGPLGLGWNPVRDPRKRLIQRKTWRFHI